MSHSPFYRIITLVFIFFFLPLLSVSAKTEIFFFFNFGSQNLWRASKIRLNTSAVSIRMRDFKIFCLIY